MPRHGSCDERRLLGVLGERKRYLHSINSRRGGGDAIAAEDFRMESIVVMMLAVVEGLCLAECGILLSCNK